MYDKKCFFLDSPSFVTNALAADNNLTTGVMQRNVLSRDVTHGSFLFVEKSAGSLFYEGK